MQTTDFSRWTDAQIRSFLDLRGGDHDDCVGRQQLVGVFIVNGMASGNDSNTAIGWHPLFLPVPLTLPFPPSLAGQIDRAEEVETNTGPAGDVPPGGSGSTGRWVMD